MQQSAKNPKRVIQVQVPPDLADLIPAYLDARYEDVDAIKTALAQLDFPRISVLGHRMHGTGASYGFDELTEIGTRLEAAAAASDHQAAEQALGELEQYLDALELI